jgi:hypothetical protein
MVRDVGSGSVLARLVSGVKEGGLAWWVSTPRRMFRMDMVTCISSPED